MDFFYFYCCLFRILQKSGGLYQIYTNSYTTHYLYKLSCYNKTVSFLGRCSGKYRHIFNIFFIQSCSSAVLKLFSKNKKKKCYKETNPLDFFLVIYSLEFVVKLSIPKRIFSHYRYTLFSIVPVHQNSCSAVVSCKARTVKNFICRHVFRLYLIFVNYLPKVNNNT